MTAKELREHAKQATADAKRLNTVSAHEKAAMAHKEVSDRLWAVAKRRSKKMKTPYDVLIEKMKETHSADYVAGYELGAEDARHWTKHSVGKSPEWIHGFSQAVKDFA